MFKRKQKKSHKNDEIYIDYSNDIDVKKADEDEAIPEHYEALKVDDEVVVSNIQIKEAIQQKAQDNFIKQKEESTLEELNIQEDKDEYKSLNNASDAEDEPFLNDDFTQEISNDQEVDETLSTKEISSLEEKNDKEFEVKVSKELQSHHKDGLFEDGVDHHEDDQQQHSIYPSFLHEELSVRRNLEPIENDLSKDDDMVEDFDDSSSQDSEEEMKHSFDEEVDSIDDSQEDEELLQTQILHEKKRDLHSYFDVDASVLKRKIKSSRKKNDKVDQEDQRKPLYQYKHHLFYSMDDFMQFLESNYRQLNEIAQTILKDEQFFRWLKEESNQFEESITKMRKFKQELKQ